MRTSRVAAKTGVSPHVTRTMTTYGVMARVGLWMGLTFVLNLVWEVAQVRLYTLWYSADGISIAWALLHCTLGDVVIALAMFVVTGIMLWRLDWPERHPWLGGVIVVIGAMAFTAWSEWYNVYRAGNWAYTARMPMIFGIGLSPLMQWLILPPVILAAYRRLGLVLFGLANVQSTNPAHDS
jgi:hypothetical protein